MKEEEEAGSGFNDGGRDYRWLDPKTQQQPGGPAATVGAAGCLFRQSAGTRWAFRIGVHLSGVPGEQPRMRPEPPRNVCAEIRSAQRFPKLSRWSIDWRTSFACSRQDQTRHQFQYARAHRVCQADSRNKTEIRKRGGTHAIAQGAEKKQRPHHAERDGNLCLGGGCRLLCPTRAAEEKRNAPTVPEKAVRG